MTHTTIATERVGLPDTDQTPGEWPIGNAPALACDLNAIADEQRAAHQIRARRVLHEAAQEVRELPAGYALRFTADDYAALAEFIANERLCCPFFTFELEVTPECGPIWLRLTGQSGVKEFLQAMLDQ
jgi:hypothetical protein